MATVYQNLLALIDEGALEVIERVDLPSRTEGSRPIPRVFAEGPLRSWLKRRFPEGQLWTHQSLALEAIASGENVVIATGTASGKSLIFQLPLLQAAFEESGKALVLYPLKALLGDQLTRWRSMAVELGLPASSVVELSGDVEMSERASLLAPARIVVATPDVVQSWIMRNVTTPAVREFLRDLRYLVLDEAHTYESVFGSNTAYLLRRVFAAKHRISRGLADRLQMIAATATIQNPEQHLCALTGYPFVSVGEDQDGSPRHARMLLHIAAPKDGGEGALREVLHRVTTDVADGREGTLIAFLDSRQGVERVSSGFESDDIVPYRGGYEAGDRKNIEKRMREGRLRAVVATSALELGIDIPGMTVGINVGVPASKKAFRQRLGRVGRASPGIFVVLADHAAFTRLGSTFHEYYEGSVEPSYLYLDNRFIAYAHAKCLLDEGEQMGATDRQLPGGTEWPRHFAQVFSYALPDGVRPRAFDIINQMATTASSPHLAFPLRQIGETNFTLVVGPRNATERIGDIAHNQAVREAYPGALYRHYKRPLKVREWRSGAFERTIRLDNAQDKRSTRPVLYTSINLSLDLDSVVDGRAMSASNGVLAEVSMRVNESVVGFRVGSSTLLYKDLRASDPGMAKRQRDFETTGVAIRIEEPWFVGGTGEQATLRQAFADALYEMLVREKSIAPHDLDRASTRIALVSNGGPRKVTDTIVIYDAVYGGLRLTEPLFSEFGSFVERLKRAAHVAGDEAFIDQESADAIYQWYRGLKEGVAVGRNATPARDGELLVYAPGSRVSVRRNGMLIERVILEPSYQDVLGELRLVYSCEAVDGKHYILPDTIEPSGQDWRQVYWNPESGSFTELDAEQGGF
jgi:DEAD/DEAH box helicase domain-containing protein